jgi:uncharacterized protein YcnI
MPRVLVLSAVLALAGLARAEAHVSVQPAEATAGGFQVLRFGVGHGCAGKPTTALTLQIPPSVTSAHPQPKPGWTLTIEHPKDAPDRVSAVTWRGDLPADEFDEFLIHVRLPAEAGRLAFPAIQACGAETVRWTGETGGAPAPVVVLDPGGGAHAPPP